MIRVHGLYLRLHSFFLVVNINIIYSFIVGEWIHLQYFVYHLEELSFPLNELSNNLPITTRWWNTFKYFISWLLLYYDLNILFLRKWITGWCNLLRNCYIRNLGPPLLCMELVVVILPLD